MKIKAFGCAVFWGRFFVCCLAFAPRVQAQSNLNIRVMAANLTSGSNQRYETPGLDILQGLKADIVAMVRKSAFEQAVLRLMDGA